MLPVHVRQAQRIIAEAENPVNPNAAIDFERQRRLADARVIIEQYEEDVARAAARTDAEARRKAALAAAEAANAEELTSLASWLSSTEAAVVAAADAVVAACGVLSAAADNYREALAATRSRMFAMTLVAESGDQTGVRGNHVRIQGTTWGPIERDELLKRVAR